MSKKLLLADDSITIQKVIQITFAHEDYELTITDNGDAAFAKAQEIVPDLVMADVYMPGKNGYELTTAIRQDDALKNIPVLLLAGSFEPFDEDKAKSCQANAWIEKPFESQNLIDKVAELLSAAPASAAAPAAASVAPPASPQQESPVASFDDTPETAEPEDPFGDISFEEETPSVQVHEPEAAADDWSDVAVASETAETAKVAAEKTEEPVDDFSFDEELPAVEEPVATEMSSVAEEYDPFAEDEDEIMPLDDDDILGAEDLEPVPQEQTLASWSRDVEPGDDVFAESFDEEPAVDDEVFAVEEMPAITEETPVAEETDVFAEPDESFVDAAVEDSELPDVAPASSDQTEDAFAELAVEEPVAFDEPAAEESAYTVEPSPARDAESVAVADLATAEEKASTLSEEEIEKIIEKVVSGVVERLAGSILERVAWEVVPDLAENLIREEIRKIKDAAA